MSFTVNPQEDDEFVFRGTTYTYTDGDWTYKSAGGTTLTYSGPWAEPTPQSQGSGVQPGDNVSVLTNDAGYLTAVSPPLAATVTIGSLATLNATTTLLGGLLGDDNPTNYVKAGGTYAIASGSIGVTMPTNGEIVIGPTCRATINASIQLQKDPLAGTTSDRYGICFFLNGSPIGNPTTINIEDLTKPVQADLAYAGAFTAGDVLTVRIAQKAGSSADNPLVQRMSISLFGL